MQIDVINKEGQVAGNIELNEKVFGIQPSEDAMHKAVVIHLAKKRQGTAKTKIRSEVSGGGKKPWKQKGRGTARAGSTRSPIWVGGGTIHGPKPHAYNLKMTKKMNQLARKSALSARQSEENILVLEDFSLEKFRTKEIATVLKNINVDNNSVLIVLPDNNEVLYKSARNIEKVDVKEARQLSTYDILSHKKIIFFKSSVEQIESILTK